MAWLTVVRSRSMEPTLRDGTLWLTRPFGRRTVRRGDVVVADSAELGRRIVKRVVGLPGKVLVVADGRTSVDGRPLDEPYATPSVFRGTFTVPCYLSLPGCVPGSKFLYTDLDSNTPTAIPGNTAAPTFTCLIPRSAQDGPRRASLYGHGLSR